MPEPSSSSHSGAAAGSQARVEARGAERAADGIAFRWLRAGVRCLGAVVALQALLGFSGALDRRLQLAILALVLLGALIHARRGVRVWLSTLVRPGPLLAGWSALEVGLLLALLAVPFARLWSAVDGGIFTYDSLVCHLHFPAVWLHDGRVGIVPTVFGDVAAAYAPSNAELVFELLMAPLRSDYLAQRGQLPFLMLAALAIHCTVGLLGRPASRVPGLAAALVFALVPEVQGQTLCAMADIALTAAFLASLPFLIRLWRAPTFDDALSLAIALGLFVGTKAVALPFLLPILLGCCAIAVRQRRALGANAWFRRGAVLALLFVATGGFWYVRNFLLTGNPIYPVTLRIAGIELFPGVYGSPEMRAWTYHLRIDRLDFLWNLVGRGGWVLCACAAIALAQRRALIEAVFIATLIGLFWYVVPYQQPRFLFPVFALAAIAIGATAARSGPRVGTGCLAIAAIGALIEHPNPLTPWIAGAFALGVAITLASRFVPSRALVGAAWLALTAHLVLGAQAYEVDPVYYRQDADWTEAWRWMRDHVSGARVAYTGNNLPHPLHGRELSNDVRYVNVAGAGDARLDEFEQPLPGETTSAEPAFYRRGGDSETWIANLQALRIDVLYVSAMHRIVRREIESDADGFPVERAWADAHPEALRPRWSNARVRIYDVVR